VTGIIYFFAVNSNPSIKLINNKLKNKKKKREKGMNKLHN